MLVAYPALEAFRRDLARLGEGRSFGPLAGQWLQTVILLERFVSSPSTERYELGRHIVRELAGERDVTSFWSAGLTFATTVEEAGALHLCDTWVHLLERIVPTDRTLDVGRVRATRARTARKLGFPEIAEALYREVEELGETAAEPELTARAWIGFGVLALERGNFPDAKRWYQAAALVADDTACDEQSSMAHQGLMVIHATAGDFDTAIAAGWRAFDAALGDPLREAEILVNVAQALHDNGLHAAALRGFAAVVARTDRARVLLHALGGAALAAAALNNAAVVESATQRVEAIANSAWPHPVAAALLDLADAYDWLGDDARSAGYRSRAIVIAEATALHQLVFRAQERRTAPSVATTPLQTGPAVGRVLESIQSLDAPADLFVVV
jgi:tetratricopeptide (TPR) repeat protein